MKKAEKKHNFFFGFDHGMIFKENRRVKKIKNLLDSK